VLVAEAFNHRVQQVRIVGDEENFFVRFVGQGVLGEPEFVDCNNDFIVVSEWAPHRISVLSWATGDMISQFGSWGSISGQLMFPCGVRLLKGQEPRLVVVDKNNYRLCVFTLSGEYVAAMGSREKGLNYPYDVLECKDGFIIANKGSNSLVKFSRDGVKVGMFGKQGDGAGEFDGPTALAALPDGGVVVRENGGARFQVFHGLRLRKTWIAACVMGVNTTTKRARVGDTR